MSGNGANDWVEGGAGNDRVTGGSGQDAFVFREFGAANADTLTDFASNWDNMRFDNAAFTALGVDGRFASGDARFFAGAAAHDADDRIVWNSATGQVWYDADVPHDAIVGVVRRRAGATLVASDIWVI
jgi:serralysin